ncbi:MAG: TonB-dependent receptor plug domain-containing protein [Parcubacteria group bacterium]
MGLGVLLFALAAAAPDAAQAGVVAYPASFFASSQPNTAMEMVNLLPGFTFDAGSGVRGFEGAAGNVLVDGERPATKSDDLESVLRRIPASQVDHVEVIRGGAAGVDMQGKTVLANIVRKKGDSVTGLFAVANTFVYDGRQNPAMRIEGARSGDGRKLEGSFVIAGFYDDGSGDGPRVRYDENGDLLGRWKTYTEGDGEQAVGTGAYERPAFGGKIRFNGRAFFERFWYDENAHGIGVPDGQIERDDQERRDGEAGVTWNRDVGPRTKFELLGIQQLRHTDLFIKLQNPAEDLDGVLTSRRTMGESIGRAVLTFRKSDTVTFETGGESAWNWLDSKTAFTDSGQPVDLPAANVEVKELRGEAFTKATWIATPKLTLEGALRGEASRISSSGDVTLEKTLYFIKPRLSATWSPDPNDQFRARLEREVGQLNFDDFVAAVNAGALSTGNPDLEPEEAYVAEAAYERRFWTGGSAVVTVRHFEIENVIDRAPDPSGQFDAPANIGDGTRDEVALQLTLPTDKLGLKGGTLRGQSTWRRSEVTDPTTGEKREISGERPVDWQAHFTQGLPRLRATWGFDVYGSWRESYYRFDVVQTTKLPSFIAVFTEWKPRPDLSVRLEAQNATSRPLVRYLDVYEGSRDANPRAFHEAQRLENKTSVYVRIRKTFGG